MTPILILGGTSEARSLAARLANQGGLAPIVSLAGATTAPLPQGVPTRIGGFGGIEGLTAWLSDRKPAAVIDATHPYATQIQANAAAACTRTKTPRLHLRRPAWPLRPRHQRAASLKDAADALPSGATILLTTGQKDISPFTARTDIDFILRTIEPVQGLPPHVKPLVDRPPFSLAQEVTTLTDLGATHLVTKNAGGSGTAKLDAADKLGLSTVMIDRPLPPPGPCVETIDAAVAWISQEVGFS